MKFEIARKTNNNSTLLEVFCLRDLKIEAMLGLCWTMLAPGWAGQHSANIAPRWPNMAPGWTNMEPRWQGLCQGEPDNVSAAEALSALLAKTNPYGETTTAGPYVRHSVSWSDEGLPAHALGRDLTSGRPFATWGR